MQNYKAMGNQQAQSNAKVIAEMTQQLQVNQLQLQLQQQLQWIQQLQQQQQQQIVQSQQPLTIEDQVSEMPAVAAVRPLFMCALCASHVNNVSRFIMFEKTLESWSKQSSPVDLYISISYDPLIEKEIDVFIKKSQNIKNALQVSPVFVKKSKRLYQFEHFRELVKYLKSEKIINDKTYIIFTDDDDIWSHFRAQIYYNVIKITGDICFRITDSTIKGPNIFGTIFSNNDEYIELCMLVADFEKVLDVNYVPEGEVQSEEMQSEEVQNEEVRRNNIARYSFDITLSEQIKRQHPNYKTHSLRDPAKYNNKFPIAWLYFYQMDWSLEHVTYCDGYKSEVKELKIFEPN